MSSASGNKRCERTDLLFEYALEALPAHELSNVEAHVATCQDCRAEMKTLRPVIDSFISWPTDVLSPY